MNTCPSAKPKSDSTSRLNSNQVSHYHEEGYLIYQQPVLPLEKFTRLQQCFEGILHQLGAEERPEAMDVPHFMYPELFEWAFDPNLLAIVEPILGKDLALFSTHFICKPKNTGKRVPWHEDSAYWKGLITPMEVCTVWLALDPSTHENGCMMVIPRSHRGPKEGFSDYDPVDPNKNVFPIEITPLQRDDSQRKLIELQPNQCSLHDARIMHGSEPNRSNLRRCGWTLRFTSTKVKFNQEKFDGMHQVYLAQGVDHAGNTYADPTRSHPEVLAKRGASSRYKNSH